MFTAKEVREIPQQNDQGKDEQAFIVKDTALPTPPGHASIHVTDPSKPDEALRELRSDLLALLGKRMSVEEAFQ